MADKKTSKKQDMIVVGNGVSLPATLGSAITDNVTKLLSETVKKKGMMTDDIPREKLNYARVLQPTSTLETKGVFADIRPGDLYLETKPLGSKITVIPLLVWHSRAKWDRDAQGQGANLDCSSPNAVTPVDTKYAKSCAECPHSRGTKDNPSQCVKTTNVLVVDSDFSDVFVLQFSKTSASTGKKVMQIMYSGDDQEEVYHMAINVSGQRAKKGAYYVMEAEPDTKTPGEYLPALAALQDKFMKMVQGQIDGLLGRSSTSEDEPEDDGDVDSDSIPDSVE